jgi:hypothetical protein
MTTYVWPFTGAGGVSGSVTVTNFPAIQPVSGTVAVSGGTIAVSNFPASTPVTGNVNSYPAGLTIAGRVTVVTVNNTTWTALPATPLSNRNALSIQNFSGQEVKINYSAGIVGYVGMTIPNGAERFYNITQNIVVYAMSAVSSCTLNIEELS